MHVKHHLKDRGNAAANKPVSSTDPDGKVTECRVDGLGHAFLFRNYRAGRTPRTPGPAIGGARSVIPDLIWR